MTWIETTTSLQRDLKTPDFLSAFTLAQAVVAPAEALNHHPDIAFGWGYVRFTLTTHDAGGITEKDRALARLIDQTLEPLLR
ncbi:MAG: 4a-hydroxytetrahydrobiopterin dehydratase [Holophaga sp.]|nr:4a-hydroxytetrahydrobiopterin dehydratase [Holophaga sp.]